MGQDVLQPAAGSGAAVDVTDRAGRLLGQVSPVAGSVWDVSDRSARALGVVSATALPLPTGAATEATIASILARFPAAAALSDAVANPTVSGIGAFGMLFDLPGAQWERARTINNMAAGGGAAGIAAAALVGRSGANLFDPIPGDITKGLMTSQRASDLGGVLQPAANTGGTFTLAAVAGQFHYITSIRLNRSATAALVGNASLAITTTNLSGLAWRVGNAMAAGGTQTDIELTFDSPIRSNVVNTATTIILPVPGAAVLWSLAVTYFTAP